MVDISHIKKLALTHGFNICGATRATPLLENKRYFTEWLDGGYAEPLPYIFNFQDVRFNPSTLLDGARSVIVCGVSYKNEYSLSQAPPRIASYALCRDYHKTIRKMLKSMLRDMQQLYPNLQGRCFTDSAPLLEKQLAVNCGLGWIGRQSLLINPQYGSFILLGEIVIDLEIDTYNTPYELNHCKNCRLCIDSCPVGAINENRTIDTRKCISARTIEFDDSHSCLPLNGWIFGCDECQSCCPHNKKTPLHSNRNFDISTPHLSSEEWQILNEDDFTQHFAATPLKRAGIDRIIKNVISNSNERLQQFRAEETITSCTSDDNVI